VKIRQVEAELFHADRQTWRIEIYYYLFVQTLQCFII